MHILWYIEGRFFTAGVVTDMRLNIVETAPILRSFMHQQLTSLKAWREVTDVICIGPDNA